MKARYGTNKKRVVNDDAEETITIPPSIRNIPLEDLAKMLNQRVKDECKQGRVPEKVLEAAGQVTVWQRIKVSPYVGRPVTYVACPYCGEQITATQKSRGHGCQKKS